MVVAGTGAVEREGARVSTAGVGCTVALLQRGGVRRVLASVVQAGSGWLEARRMNTLLSCSIPERKQNACKQKEVHSESHAAASRRARAADPRSSPRHHRHAEQHTGTRRQDGCGTFPEAGGD